MALFARSMELSGVTHSGTAVEDATAGRFESSYGIRACIYPQSTVTTEYVGTGAAMPGGPYAGTFYHRGFMYLVGGFNISNGYTLLQYLNNAGTPVFRCQSTSNGGLCQWQYWSGAAWVNIGATATPIPLAGLYKFDLKIVCGTSFEFAITSNMGIEPVVIQSGAAAMAQVTNIDQIRANPTNNGNITGGLRHSEWIFGDEGTIGHRYAWAPPTGNGTDTAGSGAFGDVDEAVTNDADVSTLAANGDAETYTHGVMTLPAGTVKAVQVEARVRSVAGGAQNVKARLRVGGVAYDQAANFAGISGTYGPYVGRWATNPAGGSWTTTAAAQNSNEFGALAQT